VKVSVSLFATLAAYLPAWATADTAVLDLPDGATVRDATTLLEIPSDLECVRVVNGRDATLDQRLNAGDTLALFPPLAGGGGCPCVLR
jgi:sulfur-carrier protein